MVTVKTPTQIDKKREIKKREQRNFKANLLLEPKRSRKDNLLMFSIDPCQVVGTPVQIGWQRWPCLMAGFLQASVKKYSDKITENELNSSRNCFNTGEIHPCCACKDMPIMFVQILSCVGFCVSLPCGYISCLRIFRTKRI